jgi:dihydropteroate synthase
VVVGPSRKGFIGRVLGSEAQFGWEGTAAAVALAIAGGADVVRVHDVARLVRVVRMSDAIVRVLSAEC